MVPISHRPSRQIGSKWGTNVVYYCTEFGQCDVQRLAPGDGVRVFFSAGDSLTDRSHDSSPMEDGGISRRSAVAVFSFRISPVADRCHLSQICPRDEGQR